MKWIIERNGYSKETVADNGNRFLIANGYMGVRGTLDEDGKEQLAAVNLSGIYDRVGDGWREPLNAPYPLHTLLRIGGQDCVLDAAPFAAHTQALDYRHGIASRQTVWTAGEANVTVKSRRIASMDKCHLLALSYELSSDRPVTVELVADIETDIWEIYGPHYAGVDFAHEGDTVVCLARVQNSDKTVAVGRKSILCGDSERTQTEHGYAYTVRLDGEHPVTLSAVCAVYTSLDTDAPLEAVKADLAAAADFDTLLADHIRRWEEIWSVGAVELEGDDTALEAINYSLYHLNSIAPRHRQGLSIPARGLSGQTYKGAIFWDTEMFMLDYFLYTQPEVARSLVMYRVDTLPGALEKARQYGWDGAFYAWESQEGGFDACSDYNVTDVFTGRPVRTYFKDKQVHISSAIARAVMLYTQTTGDMTVLSQGGARTVIECARFYASLLLKHTNSTHWELHDVIGPDEYHERVNNNAYTNRMAAETFRWAVEAAKLLKASDPSAYTALAADLDLDTLLPAFQTYAQTIQPPKTNAEGVIEQFDGYFEREDATLEQVRSRILNPKEYWGGGHGVASDTQILKQADVVTMLEFFHKEYDADTLRRNWDYYEPRTEHGSSLSACMYALLACRFGEPDRAYPFFIKSAASDLKGGGKQWAGLVYIGGTHPAAEGGAWKVLAEGFGGLEVTDGVPTISACLPTGWKRLSFNAIVRGKRYLAVLTPEGCELTECAQ